MKKLKYNRIKAVLADQGVSNKQLAEKIGVTEGTVQPCAEILNNPGSKLYF